MMSVRLSQAGSPLSISRPLKTNSYKNEEGGLGSGSSSLKNSRIGVMGLLKCYGAQEMVRLSFHSIAHPHLLRNSWCWKDYPCVRVSLIHAHDHGWPCIYFRSVVVDHLQTLFEENDSFATAFIYCNYKEQANIRFPTLLRVCSGRWFKIAVRSPMVSNHFTSVITVEQLALHWTSSQTF